MGITIVFKEEVNINLSEFSPVDLWDMRALYLQGGCPSEIKRELKPIPQCSILRLLDSIGLPCSRTVKQRISNRAWKKRLLEKYSMTVRNYYKLLDYQDNKCFICGFTDFTSHYGGRLHVDHDHDTGRVRGLLCNRCNTFLGYVDGFPKLSGFQAFLSKSLDYKENPPAESVLY